ncbi:MAG: homogentisate phytyltransferase/homogentisate geranylgeranyltransferase [Saprospiraceae bacterium]|jgi:homogentisate phytyltransferase/homogentisate geranylgeranyltransferase
MNFLLNFIRFSRLHTIIGTSLSIFILYLIALSYSAQDNLHLPLLGWTLLSCLGANIYIVGLNQITDIDIDKINKPYLPLASGAFSLRLGYSIVIISILISLAIAIYLGKYLLLTVLLSLALGTAYSLPPFRLKRFSFWAAFCIIAVRGLIVNLLLFLHFHAAINFSHTIPPTIWLLTATIFVYSIIIALFKDIPDMEGDRQFNIRTLSIRVGAQKVFMIGNIMLGLTFLALIIFSLSNTQNINTPLMVIVHLLFIIALLFFSKRTKIEQPVSMSRYYQFIWVLFFGEYIVFGLAQW